MGRVKEFLIDHEFHPLSEKYVCSDCIEDYGLKNFILENAESNECSYSGKQNRHSKIATDINEVIIFLLECIKSEWGDPNDEGVSWISREGGWVSAPVIDTYDLLADKLEIGFNNDEVGARRNFKTILIFSIPDDFAWKLFFVRGACFYQPSLTIKDHDR